MTSKMNVSLKDYSEEASKCSLHFTQMTAANHDTIVAAMAAVASEIDDITDAIETQYNILHSTVKLDNSAGSSDTESRRERKLFVIYEDDSSKNLYQVEIPSPDMSQLTYDGKTDEVDIADGAAMADLVSALETNCCSPEGNTLTVTRAYVTGRLL